MMSDRWAVYHGDCREVMEAMEPESIDSIVSDPPYGLSFMGKGWDHGVPGVEFWQAALRVAKPGAHLLAFGGTRTFHRLACAIEDAGWDIRDCLMWVYGSGFPKSHNLKGEWSGWGTALKPAWEPIILARKPLSGTVAANVQEYGTGGINVDGCRVGFHGEADKAAAAAAAAAQRACRDQNKNRTAYGEFNNGPASLRPYLDGMDKGRWPANLIHDGSDEVVGLFPETGPAKKADRGKGIDGSTFQNANGSLNGIRGHNDNGGSAARFFYCAKTSKADRDEGCEGLDAIHRSNGNKWTDQDYRVANGERPPSAESGPRRNHHPTVKPTDLMRYLCRLVTPPDGLVFDPFTGSGSTGKAAMLEGLRFVGAELSPEYIEIARARIGHAAGKTRQKELALA